MKPLTENEIDDFSNFTISPNSKVKWAKGFVYRIQDPDHLNDWLDGLVVKMEEPNFFKEPFESTWLKMGALAAFLLAIFESLILLAFIIYERQGLAEPFRTVINQLVSNAFIMLMLYIYGPLLIDLSRIWLDPLPPAICSLSIIAKNTICIIMGILMILCMTIAKFMFICVWKNMRQLDDNFLVRFIMRSSWMISFMLSLTKAIVHSDELILNHVICIGHFNPLKETGSPPFPIYEVFAGLAFLVCIALMVGISVQKRKIQIVGNPVLNANQNPKCMLNLYLNVINLSTIVAAAWCSSVMNKSGFQLDENMDWFYPYFIHFLAPLMMVTSSATQIVIENGKDMRRELLGASIQPVD